jgi:hypothetical protein
MITYHVPAVITTPYPQNLDQMSLMVDAEFVVFLLHDRSSLAD